MVGTRNKPADINSSPSRTVRSPTKRPYSPTRAGTPKLACTPTKRRNTSPDRGTTPRSTRTPTKQRNLSPDTVSTPTKRRDTSPDRASTPKSTRTPTKRRDVSPDRASTPKSIRTPTKRRDVSPDRASTPKSTRTPIKRRDTSPDRASTPKCTRTPIKQRNGSPEMVLTPRSLRTPTKKLNIPSDLVDTPSCRTPTTSRTPCAVSNLGTPMTEIDIARLKLHVSAVPDTPSGRSSLPCPLIRRENEFKTLHTFLSEKIRSRNSGYMYISGNPGSGKTATVHRVIKRLQSERRSTIRFKYIEINGLRLTDPSRAYCKILEQLNEEIAPANQALKSLNGIFSSRTLKQLPVILFVDEMDCIYNRSSTVMTNILQWHQKPNSQLTILTVANNDDLISSLEDNFKGKIKITNLFFDKYSYQDLEKIVMDRLQGSNIFEPNVVEFVIKKCASEDGDARKILDIFRKILDIVTEDDDSVSDITLNDVQAACQKISVDPFVLAIKSFSTATKLLLRTLRDETSTIDGEGCSPNKLYPRFRATCLLEGEPCLSIHDVCRIAGNLKTTGFLKIEERYVNIHSKIKLDIDANLINTALFYCQ